MVSRTIAGSLDAPFARMRCDSVGDSRWSTSGFEWSQMVRLSSGLKTLRLHDWQLLAMDQQLLTDLWQLPLHLSRETQQNVIREYVGVKWPESADPESRHGLVVFR